MYGMRVFKQDGTIRLDPGDRQVMHYAYYDGTLARGNSITITVGGGYSIGNGDWGIDITPVDDHLSAISTNNKITLTLDSDFGTINTTSVSYRVNIFKLNQ